MRCPCLFERLYKTNPPPALDRVFSGIPNGFEFLNQLSLIEQERLSGLESAEPVHEPDRQSSMHPEQIFERRPIDHWSREAGKPLQGFRNTGQPLWFARHRLSLCIV